MKVSPNCININRESSIYTLWLEPTKKPDAICEEFVSFLERRNKSDIPLVPHSAF
jgi:hypothetical protein